MYDDICIKVVWSNTSSADSPFSLITSLFPSNCLLLLGLPIFLLPYSSIPISLLPILSSSLLTACPYHFNNLLRFPLLSYPPDFFISYPVKLCNSAKSIVAFSCLRPPIYFPVSCSTPMPLPRTSVLLLYGVENVKTSCSFVKCVITFVANHFTPPRFSGPAHVVP